MKKLYTILVVLMTSFSANSQIIITEIADPNNNASARFVELTNIGQDSFYLTGYNLIRWTNEKPSKLGRMPCSRKVRA